MSLDEENFRIQLLQDNLKTIRLICKWTLDDFGRKLGVTKQTISRLENKKVEMNRAMYIAIRAVIEEKCSKNDNEILRRALPLLLREDEGEKLSDSEYANIRKTLETIAAASSRNADVGILSNILSNALSFSFMPLFSNALTVSVFPWLTKLLKDDKNNLTEAKEPD